ncbi:MAG: ferrous iron transport protein B [Bacillota bacterium]|jgi:ferrous iron transport protein B
MGLQDSIKLKRVANDSVGQLLIEKEDPLDKIIALAGNPNVGKSTIFNSLTGLNQHTGNWPGKTVNTARGYYTYKDNKFIVVDLPGTYSLMAHSAEEEVARDFICFAQPDTTVIVCDATCLERNLNLLLQILETGNNAIICINLLDEAAKKEIKIDLNLLQEILNIPVIGTSARNNQGIESLIELINKKSATKYRDNPFLIPYSPIIEEAIIIIEKSIQKILPPHINSRWLALRLLENNQQLTKSIELYSGEKITDNIDLMDSLKEAQDLLYENNINEEKLKDIIVSAIIKKAEEISKRVMFLGKKEYNSSDRKIDKILTSRKTGIPIMISLLALVFWITISGANYPSQILAAAFAALEAPLIEFLTFLHSPAVLTNLLVLGVLKTLGWVVSVMLPPMSIFFPLFTLLEDSGYLPRIAFNLDKYFKKACACGKQALTMCMGFGCNAAGVIGCRIIDSPRERLIAIITNNFVPCNGRFPTLIALISMFFIWGSGTGGVTISLLSTVLLTALIILGVVMTLVISRLLSKTILKGVPSSFTLELPPYRKPQLVRVIISSIRDRTLFVLRRAILVATPAGFVIWILANTQIGNISLLTYCAEFLDPFATMIGMDGVILLAFILGFPANEIVLPIIIMAYLSQGSLLEMSSLGQLRDLLVNNGWTWLTALCVMLFSLMHFPCSTTCLTIKKETQSIKWTAISFLLPTTCGIAICFIITTVARVLNFV